MKFIRRHPRLRSSAREWATSEDKQIALVTKNNFSLTFSMFSRFFRAAAFVAAMMSISAQAETELNSAAVQYVRNQVRPEYPYAARVARLEGAGVFRLDIDAASGGVTKVTVSQTTGHKILDNAAIRAFQKWRFVPGVFKAVRIPIRFALTRGGFRGLEKIRANAIYCPIPPYPPMAPPGSGRFEVVVDFETGQVRDVKVLKTAGDARLDRSVTKTFRKWRFRPRTTHSFKTPFHFF